MVQTMSTDPFLRSRDEKEVAQSTKSPGTKEIKRGALSYITPWLSLLLFVLALWVLHRALKTENYHAIINSLKSLPWSFLIKSLLLTGLNFLVLTGYETLAFRYIRKSISYGRLAFTSFISYGFSNALGFVTIAGGTIRLRLYSSWGFSTVDVAKVIFFSSLTLWLGLLATAGTWLMVAPAEYLSRIALSVTVLRLIGILFASVAAGYVIFCVLRKKAFSIRSWQVSPPSPSLAITQILVSVLDWSLAGSVLYVLLPPDSGIDYVQFLGVFLLSQFSGLASQVPGGIGVFDSMIVFLLSPPLPALPVITALLIYRVIYYVLPLAAAVVLFSIHEAMDRWIKFKGITRTAAHWIPEVVPRFLMVATFLGGIVLIASGATPSVPGRIARLRMLIPLPLLEISHFLSSLVGVALLILARGLQRRLDAARYLAIALLLGGVLFSLLKGLDYEEAGVMAVILVLLVPSKRYFYRKASLLKGRFSPSWIAAVFLVFSSSLWLVFFSFKHVIYSNNLLWQFAFNGDAPRSLRAIVAVAVVVAFLAFFNLFRTAPPVFSLPGEQELEKAKGLATLSKDTSAYLALLGDKNFLFSEGGRSFIMFAVEGRSWIALRDPFGPAEEAAEILWNFREICDRYNGWPVFYESGAAYLPLYLDLGLTPLKIGEEGKLYLPGFDLEGRRHKGLRGTMHRVEREGVVFTVLPPSDVPPLLPELRSISDAWLNEKRTREKGFSLGSFREAYLVHFPMAIVSKGDRILVFANLWLGAEKWELSPDLMRHLPDAPSGIMKYLFVRLILWGKEEGYQWFNLGMVPFSGFEEHSQSPLWQKFGSQVYRHGENFYNFQGLRKFKDNFQPQWEPRYLVSPGGLHLPHILTNVASLVSGGLKGIVAK